MAKQTKQQKIDQLKELVRQVHGEGAQWDFSRVYDATQALDSTAWDELLALSPPGTPEHLPSLWFAKDADDSGIYPGAHGWLKDDLDNYHLIDGASIAHLLRGMLKRLGPNPKSIKVMWDGDDETHYVVKTRDITHAELDRSIKSMQAQAGKNQQRGDEVKRCKRSGKQPAAVFQAVQQLGLAVALQVLERELAR